MMQVLILQFFSVVFLLSSVTSQQQFQLQYLQIQKPAIQKSSLQIRSMTRVTNLTRNILSSAFLRPGGSIRLSTDGSSAAAGPLCPRENISPARPPTAMNAISCPVKRGTPCASSRSRPRLSARSTTGTSTENSSPTAPSARSAPIRSPSGWMPGASPPPPAVNGRPAL